MNWKAAVPLFGVMLYALAVFIVAWFRTKGDKHGRDNQKDISEH